MGRNKLGDVAWYGEFHGWRSGIEYVLVNGFT
jgi:hypothetical protein